jgi:hypothetical protein
MVIVICNMDHGVLWKIRRWSTSYVRSRCYGHINSIAGTDVNQMFRVDPSQNVFHGSFNVIETNLQISRPSICVVSIGNVSRDLLECTPSPWQMEVCRNAADLSQLLDTLKTWPVEADLKFFEPSDRIKTNLLCLPRDMGFQTIMPWGIL